MLLAGRIGATLRRLRRATNRPSVAARLYVTDGCGLCTEARHLIEPFEQRGQVVVELVDIAADAELFRRYCLSIPVLELVGGLSLDWPFDRADLRRVLR